MKIAIACHATIGGSGIIATEIGVELARRGHTVHFVSAEEPWRLDLARAANVQFHRVTATPQAYLPALAATLAELGPSVDVLWAHYALPHTVALYLAKQMIGARAPRLVTTLHGTDVTFAGHDPALGPMLRFCLQTSDVTVPSQYLARAAQEAYGLERVEVIANFVDTKHFVPAQGPREAVIVHASNFRPVKRTADVMRVFAAVRKRRPARLLLAGDGDDRAAVEALAGELGVANDVAFLGRLHDVANVVKNARVFLLPSESESFGVAALEAQSAGVPVVGSAVGGVGEVVRDGETGFLFAPGNVEAMAQATLRLLDEPQLFATMSEKARDNAVRRFDKRAQVDRYESYLLG